MASVRSQLWEWVNDETIRTLVLFLGASALGLASVLLFFTSPGTSPTQFHLALMISSMLLVFYLTIRATPA